MGTDAGLRKKTIFGTVADPDLEIRKGGEGGGGGPPFGPKIKGGGPPGPSPGSATAEL